MMLEEPCDRLKKAREDAGYHSVSEAARALNMKGSTYTAHENGQNRFKYPQAVIYAAKFGVSPIWLMYGKEAEIDNSIPEFSMTYNSETGAYGLPQGHIPEIDLVAGLGGGGIGATEVTTHNGITFSADVVRASWFLPDWMLARLNVKSKNVACFPAQGDSMEPNIMDGDVVFIDTRHRVPSPPGIYAITDEFGGVVLKSVQVISRPSDQEVTVRISSDNPKYSPMEVPLSEVYILGRYVGRFTV